MILSNPLLLEFKIKARVSKVWNALTDSHAMKHWFFLLDEFSPVPGFEFTFSAGPDENSLYIHHCMVMEAIPNHKLSFNWCYEGIPGYSEVSFNLMPEGHFTLIQFLHQGLDSFPANHPALKRENFEDAWKYIINIGLRNYLENGE